MVQNGNMPPFVYINKNMFIDVYIGTECIISYDTLTVKTT